MRNATMSWSGRKYGQVTGLLALGAAILVTLGACAHVAHVLSHRDVARPPADQFGNGPRTSSAGLYTATIEPPAAIEVGRMERWQIRVQDADGRPVEDDATIEVDGGMPQHGHGLPTRPRVTDSLGSGVFVVDGMKFNMGGWWEVKLRIASSAGADSITFNIDL